MTKTLLAGGLVLVALGIGACGAGKHDATADSPPTTRTSAPVLPGTGKPQVTIGDKNFSEQFLLGELYAQALSAQGYSVQLNRNIGPTEVTLQALYSGRLDMYPEYLSTWNTDVAGYKHGFATEASAYHAARHYARQHGLKLLQPTPFSDTGGIAVTVAYAVEHGLHSLGDLRKVASGLTFGAPPEFQQGPGGLGTLEQVYGFVPAAFKPLAVGGGYQALDQGVVQAAWVNTTDGQLENGSYRLLGDPQNAFGWGQAVPVVPAKVLAAEGPAFAATIDKVSKLLTTATMQDLNDQVAVYQQDPAAVAKEFLQAHGLVPQSS
jgi:osmoprotectant transport system substrate-binding protein